MVILAMSEIKLLKFYKTGKTLKTMIHFKKKILSQSFAEYPKQEVKEKH